MKINKLGVNFCRCLLCSTEFYFEPKDIDKPRVYLDEIYPRVQCPICGFYMTLGLDRKHFTYREKDENDK